MGFFKNILKDASDKCSICGEEVYEGIFCDFCADIFICRDCLEREPRLMRRKGDYRWACSNCM